MTYHPFAPTREARRVAKTTCHGLAIYHLACWMRRKGQLCFLYQRSWVVDCLSWCLWAEECWAMEYAVQREVRLW